MTADGKNRRLVHQLMSAVLTWLLAAAPALATPPPGENPLIEAIGFAREDAWRQYQPHDILYPFIQVHNKHLSPPQVEFLADIIVGVSQRYGIDYRILASIIAVESSFRPDAVSSSGAIGLGQLKPATARWLGVHDPYDPRQNAAGTARYLSFLLKKYDGDMDLALSAYYQGPGTVDRQGITPACQPYLNKVNGALAKLP